jgi:hypothetical protein
MLQQAAHGCTCEHANALNALAEHRLRLRPD